MAWLHVGDMLNVNTLNFDLDNCKLVWNNVMLFLCTIMLQQYIFQYLFCADIRLQVTKELNPRYQTKGVLFPCIKRGAAMNLASGLWDLQECVW